jgi:hypothetical protein
MKSEIHPRFRSRIGIKVILLTGRPIHLNYWTNGPYTDEGVTIYWTSQKGENKRAVRQYGEKEFKEIP